MATSDLTGRRLVGRYVLQERISAGGMATVWRARDEVLGRDVALKILHDELADDQDVLERFRLEAVASARLGDPAVVRVFDTGVDEGVSFIVMELFRGETAAMLLERRGPLPAEEAIAIARGVLRGLAHAHATGIVHRDVKPSNILIGEDGSVKVTDFGIAKAAFAGGDITTTGNLLGTAKYLAPEQVQGGPADARSDIYGVGVVLYQLLSGRPPFEAETHIATATMRLTNDPPALRSLRPDVAPELEAVVMKALAREPGVRFQTAEEFGAALDDATGVAASRTQPRPSRRDRRAARPARPPSTFRSWVYVPLALVLLVALGIAGYVLVQEFGRPDRVGNGRGDARAPRALDIETAVDYDPLGDESENPDEAALAADGDPETAWTTENYDDRLFAGLKDGVGLYVDLGRSREVGAIRLTTPTPGWTFRVDTGEDLDDFSDVIATPAAPDDLTARREQTLKLEPESARYVLVWITDLTPADGWRASIAEVEILPPGG